jgi:hypothetical protein
MSKRNTPDTDPLAKARAEACEIFKLDPAALSAADELRVGMFATLRLAIDTESAKAATASGVDLGKLNTATELMTKMLPTALSPPEPKRFTGDPAKRLAEIVVGAIRATDPSGKLVPLETELDRLRRENQQLRAALGTPAPTQRLLPAPIDKPLPDAAANAAPNAANASPPEPPAPQTLNRNPTDVVILHDGDRHEPWRDYVGGNSGFFWDGRVAGRGPRD